MDYDEGIFVYLVGLPRGHDLLAVGSRPAEPHCPAVITIPSTQGIGRGHENSGGGAHAVQCHVLTPWNCVTATFAQLCDTQSCLGWRTSLVGYRGTERFMSCVVLRIPPV